MNRVNPTARRLESGHRRAAAIAPRLFRGRARRSAGRLVAWLAVPALAAAGCGTVEQVRDYFADAITPHERYAASLLAAGLEGTALARDWLAASAHALDSPVSVTPPHGEDGFLSPDRPMALAFRIPARRGQRLRFEARLLADSSALLFLDLFEIPADSLDPPRRLASADSGATALEYEPRRDGEYLLRFQPELLRGGRYTVTIRAEPILAFPVQGHRLQDIGSVFGDPRDGGRRDHHGVDIFAPRGTPALAAIDATVRRVQSTDIGGKVVWLRDEERGLSLYYAHLDSQTVSTGMRVSVGDVVGLIGNSGNARTTPPHLHFGVYQRGPVDPYPFVYLPRGRIEPLALDPAHFGRWSRTVRDGVMLREQPREQSTPTQRPALAASGSIPLPRHTALFVLAGSGTWLRVQLPDGRLGWVAAAAAENADAPVRDLAIESETPLHVLPRAVAETLVDRFQPGAQIDVLARFGEFLLVREENGLEGWILDPLNGAARARS